MVICAIVGCSNNSKRRKGIRFFRLPAVISHQGDKAKELSEKRRSLWLARIHRADITPDSLHQYSCLLPLCFRYKERRYLFSVTLAVACSVKLHTESVTAMYCCLGEPSQLFDESNVDWAPSFHLGHDNVPKVSSTERYSILFLVPASQ